jgi:hypothetical protein
MQPPFPCPTATWRNDTYASILPSRKELSVAGKTVIIIGGVSVLFVNTPKVFLFTPRQFPFALSVSVLLFK